MQAAQTAARQAGAAQSRLEAAEAETSGAVARLERKVVLLTKERNVLKEIVASYDAEEANFAGMVFNKLSFRPACLHPIEVYPIYIVGNHIQH